MRIIRSFEQTIQLKQFEPIKVSCSAETECGDGIDEAERASRNLDRFVREEVAKTISSYRPEEKIERPSIDYSKPPYKYPGSKPQWPSKPLAEGQETPATIDDVVGVGDPRQTKNLDR